MSLTPKQAQFVREYLIDLNATQAAIRCGYSERTAKQQGSRLLTVADVADAVQQGMDRRASKAGITAERVLNEIAKMAFFDPRKLFDDQGKPIHVSQLDDDTAAAVAGLDVVQLGNQDVGYAEVLKVKLADKARSLEMLGRHLKLFTDKVEHSGEVSYTVATGVPEPAKK